MLDHGKSKRVPEKHLFLLYWLRQSLWLYGSQQTVENSERVGMPDHLICLLRNLYAGQEATVRSGHGTTDWFQIRKGVHQGYILSPCLFNFCAECMLSHFSRVQLFETLWTVVWQAPLSMAFSRQEYYLGLPCPPPGDLPNPGIEPMSLSFPALAGGFLTTRAAWEAL